MKQYKKINEQFDLDGERSKEIRILYPSTGVHPNPKDR